MHISVSLLSQMFQYERTWCVNFLNIKFSLNKASTHYTVMLLKVYLEVQALRNCFPVSAVFIMWPFKGSFGLCNCFCLPLKFIILFYFFTFLHFSYLASTWCRVYMAFLWGCGIGMSEKQKIYRETERKA